MASIMDIQWSDRSYSTKEVIEHFRLPKIFKVTKGLYGTEDTETLGNLQVVRLHRQHRQRRVIATDDRGRHFSIPVDYDIPFEILPVSLPKLQPKYLSQILREHNLPKRVRFGTDMELDAWYIDNNVKVDNDFGAFTLMKVYEETYLQGNAINDGILDEQHLVVPVYMKLEFAVAEGFSNSDDKHWEDMKRAYDAIVLQRVDFDQSQTGNKDISMYFPRNVQRHHHDYANIEPNKTIRIRSKKSRSYENRLDIDSEPRMNNSPDHTNAKTSVPAPAPPVGKSLDPPIFSEDGITLVKKEARSEPAKNDFTKKKNKKEKNTSGVNKSGPNRGGKSDKRYKTLSELPSDLTKLTVGQVGDLLRLLDLELWVALFDENGVDGELLRKLTAVQLTENFKLPRVDALKITTYYMENHKEKKKKFALF